MDRAYHVQYGLHPRIGVFPSTQPLVRGDSVVIASRRGTELGRVVSEAEPVAADHEASAPRILRQATPADLATHQKGAGDQGELFAAFRSVFDEAVWPIQLIDVEPLLGSRETVLYYLGPHRLDFTGLAEALSSRLGVNVAFEPLGKDVEPEEAPVGASCGAGGCGSGECGSSGCDSCDSGGCLEESPALKR